ncbi:pantoate--beta-alanine ligase [Salipaludibacillus neizhouensis]|uniref:Pantothenate synthetase n=1 Tax=Salipaludibacillus neizhouensis TaxID=885475 RepID=A0A3A9K4K4_9BACI|nr:pantoate--beta-alanine ligase [Salipaludibacillus neizhouensis]RKL67557.1 pantoate--beta-alanine ligase [Salipaludibacillus neizhouensis]
MIEMKTRQELTTWIKKQKQLGSTIGFVPTMGFLHEGHLSLVEQAKKKADIVVMSIFVNPLQFGEGEDYESYPRDHDRDKELADSHGVDVLFSPGVEEMYPRPMSTTLVVHEGTDVLCGQSRPGHFNGVATVVLKLLQITSADYAYFGLKDAQQVAIIQRMVEDFHLATEIIPIDIVRESDGLAKSSRNVNLNLEERQEAPEIYSCLKDASRKTQNGDFTNSTDLEDWVRLQLQKKLTGKIDYVQVLEFPSLKAPKQLEGKILLATAVYYKRARLIDNIVIEIKG